MSPERNSTNFQWIHKRDKQDEIKWAKLISSKHTGSQQGRWRFSQYNWILMAKANICGYLNNLHCHWSKTVACGALSWWDNGFRCKFHCFSLERIQNVSPRPASSGMGLKTDNSVYICWRKLQAAFVKRKCFTLIIGTVSNMTWRFPSTKRIKTGE